MPTYVYECSACEQTYEIEQRIIEDALTDCHCGSKGTVKRIIQPTAIMFKGSGFYVNDSQKESKPAADPPEKVATPTDSTPVANPRSPSGQSVNATPEPSTS